YTKPQIAKAVWGFFFVRWKTTLRVGCATRTAQGAVISVRAAHPTGLAALWGVNKKATLEVAFGASGE
uniref:hypothetical protein n=1 Tax=Pseudomonas sp. EggHat1 TaxID=2761624 RepID=UPI001D02B03B